MPVTTDLSALSDDELEQVLEELTAEESTLSKRRARLHDRMDFLRSGGASHSPVTVEQLRGLEDEERQLSENRRAIHQSLTDVQGERTRRRDRS